MTGEQDSRPSTLGLAFEPSPQDADVASAASARLTSDLDTQGYAVLRALLTPEQCATLIAGYTDNSLYRSRIVMARHNFGRGEYQYFCYPLPDIVQCLRDRFYRVLAMHANAWMECMSKPTRYPTTHADYLAQCHAEGQCRPTPLLLRYGPDDYNCLHQDLYGEMVFPLQLAVLLNAPGEDFEGGEFVLTEQRPRMQSRASVVPLLRGDGVVFAVNERPIMGKRGYYRVKQRHGVSTVRSGCRHTLGVIFHDAA